MITTMSREEFGEAWRKECREYLDILTSVDRHHDGPKTYGKSTDESTSTGKAIAIQRRRRGALLLDRVKAGELVIQGSDLRAREGNGVR
jgi:hypothetical protein